MKPYSRTFSARLSRAFSRAFAALRNSDRRRAFVRELFFRAAKRFTPAVVVESHGLRYLMSTDDHGVGMTLFMGDDVEHRTFKNAVRVLSAQGLEGPAGRTLIDIGAHVGTTTVTALCAFSVQRAICFEPSPRNRELLNLNLVYNGLKERAKIVPVALSNRTGVVEFEVAPMNPSDGRIRVAEAEAEAGAFGEETWETIEVPMAELDSYVKSGEVDLDSLGMVPD